MTKSVDWSAPTTVLSQARLDRLLDRSTKMTESLEVEMILGDAKPPAAAPPAPRSSHDRLAMEPLPRIAYPTYPGTRRVVQSLMWAVVIAAAGATIAAIVVWM